MLLAIDTKWNILEIDSQEVLYIRELLVLYSRYLRKLLLP